VWSECWGWGEEDEGKEVYGKSIKLDACIFEAVLFESEEAL